MSEKFKISNLDLYYGDFHALKDINMSIHANEITAFIGPSGCGKSTILNVLAGLIEDYSSSVFVDDEPITGISSHFAYMPQSDLLLE